MFGQLWRRIQHLFSKSQFDEELEEEIRLHQELRAEKLKQAGLAEKDARSQAKKQFGNTLLLKESSQETWRWSLLENLGQDLRYAWRQMMAHKVLSLAVLFTLSLGIGATTSIFSIFEAIILRTLAVPHPEQLYLLQTDTDLFTSAFSHPLFTRMQKKLPEGSSLVANTRATRGPIQIDGKKDSASFQMVSGNYYDTLQIKPALGRLFTEEDDRAAGNHPVTVLSHRFWMNRFAGSPDVLGKSIVINRQPLTVIGVAPAEFHGLWPDQRPDFWVPVAMQSSVEYSGNRFAYGDFKKDEPWAAHEGIFWLQLIARIPNDKDVSALQASLNIDFTQAMEQVFGRDSDPEARRQFLSQRLVLMPGNQGIQVLIERYFTPLNILLGMSGLLLLITCANIASLLMGRAEKRQREIAVRMSIGASRQRLIRQLLTESLLMGVIGSLVGGFLGFKLGPELLRLIDPNAPQVNIAPNAMVLGFSFILCLFTTVLFGLAPALKSTRLDLSSALKLNGSHESIARRFNFGQVMVSVQVALSMMLLVSSVLLSRTLNNLMTADTGFEAEHIISISFDPQSSGYSPEQTQPLFDRIESRIQKIPGVQSTALSACIVLAEGCIFQSGMYTQGFVATRGQKAVVQELFVGQDYVRTLGLTLMRGRAFTTQDQKNTQAVALINQKAARFYFGHEDVVGKRIGYSLDHPDQFEIVGVLKDTAVNNLKEEIPKLVIRPGIQDSVMNSLNVRVEGDSYVLISSIQLALKEEAPGLAVNSIRTVRDRINQTFTKEQSISWLSSAFGVIATVLAGIGLYGLLSYRVARRTAEIGIRMALGAGSGSVQWLVLRGLLVAVGAGLSVGLVLSLYLSKFLKSMLFGISNTDPITYVLVMLIFLVCAFVAVWIPARRATHIDPMNALRAD